MASRLASLIRYILEVRDEPPHVTQAFFKQLLGKAGEEGFMTGAQQLTEQVRQQSKAQSRAESILLVLERRGIALTSEQRARVLDTTDVQLLDSWLGRAAVCSTSDEVFG